MRKKLILSLILVFVVGSVLFVTLRASFADPLENDVMVEKDSDLTYYLTVNYDGKDYKSVESSDTQISQVSSDIILVEDKLPAGLTFKSFVSTADGTIGAVKRSDGSGCGGYVIDGVNGLSYDEDTRVVSYKIKNLVAGCKITVGITTRTPKTVDDFNTTEVETRRDFYNTATTKEGFLTSKSNTVHVFMGDENTNLYTVKYEYIGNVPANAPEVPIATSYAQNSTVGVENNINLAGYKFSGWITSDVTVTNGNFTMPAKEVVFRGNFTKTDANNVSYQITGDYPKSYTVPRTSEYYSGEVVHVDSLKVGDIVRGYKFLGWTVKSGGVTISEDNDFEMPNNDIVLNGSFEKVSYQVTYKFQGVNIPSQGDSLLPASTSYYPGDEVTVAENPVAPGYTFLGWYSNNKFTMPAEDVIIYGEWMVSSGTFEPSIKKEIVNQKSFYKKGDTVNFKITVTNNANYSIKDVMIKENNSKTTYIESSNYEIMSKSIAKIPIISAGSSVVIEAKYIVDDGSLMKEENEVEIIGALADNNYYLNTTKAYKSKVEFIIKRGDLKVNYVVSGDVPSTYIKPDEKIVEYDTAYTSLKVDFYEGYSFDGWYVDKDYKTKYKNGTKLTSNITLYGKFTKITNPFTRTIHTMYHKGIFAVIFISIIVLCLSVIGVRRVSLTGVGRKMK